MRGRVHQPGGVQTNDGAKEDAPQQVLPSSRNKNDRTQCGNGHPMPMGDPHVELMSAKIRNIGQKISRFVVHRPASEDPAHVGPETAIAGRMRITILVGILVVHAMCSHPKHRSAF